MKGGLKFVSHIDSDRPQKILKALWRGVDWGADKIQARAKYFVPVDTGRLQKSIKIGKMDNGKSIAPDTDYDIYVEMGTSRMAAQPYMRPALIEQKKAIADYTVKQLRAVLK